MLLGACAVLSPTFEKPSVSVVGVEMQGGNILQQNFLVTLKIHNPNTVALPVKGLTADLRVNGEEIASGTGAHPVTVPALGDANFDLSISANVGLAILKLSQHADRHAEALTYDLTGVVSLDVPLFHSLPFHETGTLDLKGLGN